MSEDSLLLAWMWQVILHSLVCGVVFYVWTRNLGLPSGRSRRRLLATSLVLPLLTALVPGRTGMDFRAAGAWFDGGRVLAIPVAGGFDVRHLVATIAMLAILATLGQELLPALRLRRRPYRPSPVELLTRARRLPGWEACRVVCVDTDDIVVATDGRPWRPRAILSRGALATLTAEQIDVVLRHEHAHWRRGRWWVVHALFLCRAIQLFNPVALWCFREYCLEVEIHCDADAVQPGGLRALVRALLAVYETTAAADRSAAALRKRVDVLLGRRSYDTLQLTPATEATAIALLALTLPWLV